MKLLHIDASSKFHQWSNSRALGRYFIERLRHQGIELEIDYLDVTEDIQPHITAEFAQATYVPESARTAEMKATLAHSDALCQRVLDADALVCAMPMYNWTIPSTFKTFIDNITRMDITYNINADGSTSGRLDDKTVLFITTRGGDLRPGGRYENMDAMTPVLKASCAFIGIPTPMFVDAQPLEFADQPAREAALIRAYNDLDNRAAEWAAIFASPQAKRA